jgi:hypothetical protein
MYGAGWAANLQSKDPKNPITCCEISKFACLTAITILKFFGRRLPLVDESGPKLLGEWPIANILPKQMQPQSIVTTQ